MLLFSHLAAIGQVQGLVHRFEGMVGSGFGCDAPYTLNCKALKPHNPKTLITIQDPNDRKALHSKQPEDLIGFADLEFGMLGRGEHRPCRGIMNYKSNSCQCITTISNQWVSTSRCYDIVTDQTLNP